MDSVEFKVKNLRIVFKVFQQGLRLGSSHTHLISQRYDDGSFFKCLLLQASLDGCCELYPDLISQLCGVLEPSPTANWCSRRLLAVARITAEEQPKAKSLSRQ